MMVYRSLAMLSAVLLWAPMARAQNAPRVEPPPTMFTAVPGAKYASAPIPIFIAGSNWRDVWVLPWTVPVLDLGTFAGGLTPTEEGGNQSKTLRFTGKNGRLYIFRSTEKFVHKALPEDLKQTPIGNVMQDQASALHPSSALVVARLQTAVNLLHAPPQEVIMPDDPRLGKFRDTFRGMLGQIEERPDEIDDGEKPGFAGAKKFSNGDKLLEDLEESSRNQLASEEYLTARLIDFLIGDLDRGADQWRFARFDEGDVRVWRPIPRDRDYAFMASTGLLAKVVSKAYPKLQTYSPKYPAVTALTFMTRDFDRSHLVELPWPTWTSVVTRVQSALSDAVIDDAIRQMPPEQQAASGPTLAANMRARREQLPAIARDYYELVAREADVFGSDEAELVDIERLADGGVRVLMRAAKSPQSKAWFDRHFDPNETSEIRIYLQGENDRAVVRGSADRSITVRVTGGAGDDVLIDSSTVRSGGTATAFYDASGANRIEAGRSTKVSTKSFVTFQPQPEVDEGEPKPPLPEVREERRGRFQDQLNDDTQNFLKSKLAAASSRSWGGVAGFEPKLHYSEGAGLTLGIGHSRTDFGFRFRPYATRVQFAALYGVRAGGFGAEASADFRRENSAFGLELAARASQFEANRFYGFGNDTEEVDPRLALVVRDEAAARAALTWSPAPNRTIAFGPVMRYVKPHPENDSPAAGQLLLVNEAQGQVGLELEAEIDGRKGENLPRGGFALHALANTYPAVWDVATSFSRLEADGALYVPVGPLTLALRTGATRVFGDFPMHEAAFLGGRTTLRGFRWNRFTGDAEVHGGAQLHLPLGRLTLLTRGNFGVFALGDAGRVWFDGESDGNWHRGLGGGLTFETVGQLLSVAYASGERSRVYVQLGSAISIR